MRNKKSLTREGMATGETSHGDFIRLNYSIWLDNAVVGPSVQPPGGGVSNIVVDVRLLFECTTRARSLSGIVRWNSSLMGCAQGLDEIHCRSYHPRNSPHAQGFGFPDVMIHPSGLLESAPLRCYGCYFYSALNHITFRRGTPCFDSVFDQQGA